MRYSISNKPTRLITIGIIKMVFLTFILTFIYKWITTDFVLSQIWQFVVFILIFFILVPIVFFIGISDINYGRKEIRIEIDGIFIRKYENEKLKLELTVKTFEKILHLYHETLEWRVIVLRFTNKKKIKLTITKKKDFPKIEEFFKFLVYYSRKYDIPFEEKKFEIPIIMGF